VHTPGAIGTWVAHLAQKRELHRLFDETKLALVKRSPAVAVVADFFDRDLPLAHRSL